MFLAAVPDIDWIYPPFHRGPTHSVGAALLVTLIAAAVTQRATGQVQWKIALTCGLAYGSHILMDWLGEDRTIHPGVMAFWPFGQALFYSGLDWFRSTERIGAFQQPQLQHNLRTLLQEFVILGPVLLFVLWQRRKRRH
jgi:hypothetical protein